MHWILCLLIVLAWSSDAVAQSTRLSNPNLGSDNSISSSSKTPVLPCTANASAPSWDEGRQVPCSEDLSGNLRVTQGSFGPGENATAQELVEIYTSNSGIPVRYTTTGNKSVKASFGEIVGVIVWSGTTVTLTLWDDADGTCNSNQLSGTFTPTVGRFEPLPFRFSVGICAVVAGTSPDLTLVYK